MAFSPSEAGGIGQSGESAGDGKGPVGTGPAVTEGERVGPSGNRGPNFRLTSGVVSRRHADIKDLRFPRYSRGLARLIPSDEASRYCPLGVWTPQGPISSISTDPRGQNFAAPDPRPLAAVAPAPLSQPPGEGRWRVRKVRLTCIDGADETGSKALEPGTGRSVRLSSRHRPAGK